MTDNSPSTSPLHLHSKAPSFNNDTPNDDESIIGSWFDESQPLGENTCRIIENFNEMFRGSSPELCASLPRSSANSKSLYINNVPDDLEERVESSVDFEREDFQLDPVSQGFVRIGEGCEAPSESQALEDEMASEGTLSAPASFPIAPKGCPLPQETFASTRTRRVLRRLAQDLRVLDRLRAKLIRRRRRLEASLNAMRSS
ncbi:hypothetical protein HGRIS_008481 [Hohenbuehelia grisea]|uniref:Uncharacterized protein n=1 Tax=Hohenbuehelia grisea TaxID=104357 RepID=A0ABR3J828_9AGAR